MKKICNKASTCECACIHRIPHTEIQGCGEKCLDEENAKCIEFKEKLVRTVTDKGFPDIHVYETFIHIQSLRLNTTSYESIRLLIRVSFAKGQEDMKKQFRDLMN